MNTLKAVGTNGEVLTFNIPSEATEIAIGPFFETHIAFHGLRAALMAEANGTAGPVPLGAHIANLAWTLRHYTEGKNPLELKLTGTSEEEVATMLMGCAEAIANCLARHTPKAPDNEFEFNGRKWYLCQQAVNYKAKQGDGFSVKQVAQGMLLEEYFNNFLEHRLAKEVEKVIEARAAVSASELFMTPTRIFLAQMALFLRTSPDEELPKTQEAFDNWHAARIAELEQMPLSVAADIRNFFFLTSTPSATTQSSPTGSTHPDRPISKKTPTKSKSAPTAKGTKKAKVGSLQFMAGFGKRGRGKTGT